MTDTERVEKFLDELAARPLNTFEAAYELRLVIKLFPDVNWVFELRCAFDRQELEDPEANSMRSLAQHMASELCGFDE